MNKFPWYSILIAVPMVYALYNLCTKFALSPFSKAAYQLLLYCGRNSLIIFGVQSIIIEILCMFTFKMHIQYPVVLFVLATPLSMLYAKYARSHFPFK
jgi:hypothetical protein